MEKTNALTYGTAIRIAVVALALGGLSLAASARDTGRSDFNAFMGMATGSSKSTVGFGTGGVPLATAGVPGAGAVGNMNFSHTPGGWPTANGTFQAPSPLTGKSVPLTGKQAFNKAGTAKALAKFAGRVGPLGVGMAIFDLMQELGYSSEWTGSQNVFKEPHAYTLRKLAANSCATSHGEVLGDIGSLATACQGYQMTMGLKDSFGDAIEIVCVPQANGETVQCNRGQYGNVGIATTFVSLESERPISLQEIEERIAAETGWPSDSKVSAALAEAVNGGEVVQPEGNLTVAFVDQSTAANTTSEQNLVRSDGTTVDTKTQCDLVQVTHEIEWRCWSTETVVTPPKTSTETVVTSNPDGTTSTSTVTRTTPGTTTTSTVTGEEADKEKDEACPAGSLRAGCAELDSPTAEIPRETKTITYTEETPFGSGSCPSDVMASIGTLNQSMKVWDWQKTCSMALPLRALIVALASFAAFLILMPGKVET